MKAKYSVALIVLISVVAYANSFRNEFVWDDVSSVQSNKYVTSPGHVAKLFVTDQHAFGRGQGNFYRPLTSLSFMLNYRIGQERTLGYHLVNLLLHCGVALCLYFLLRMLTSEETLAFPAALLFTIHPLHTEAVTYISGRADMLVSLFGLLCLISLVAAIRMMRRHGLENGVEGGSSWQPLLLCAASAVFLILALLSKELGALFPFLALATILCFGLSKGVLPKRWCWAPVAVLFGILVAYGLLRLTVLNFAAESARTPQTSSAGSAIATPFQTLATYLSMALFPVRLHMERQLGPPSMWVVTLGILTFVVWLTGIVIAVRSRRRVLLFGLVWVALSILPVVGILPLNAPLAEHWLYVPLMGVSVLAALGVVNLLRMGVIAGSRTRKGVFLAAIVLIAACYLALTIRRNTDWRDNYTLFSKTLEYAPESARVHYNLGIVLQQRGDETGAVREFGETIRLDPANVYARVDLAYILQEHQELARAAKLYREAISLSSNAPDEAYVEANANLAIILIRAGRYPEARQHLQAALQVVPGDQQLRRMLESLGTEPNKLDPSQQ